MALAGIEHPAYTHGEAGRGKRSREWRAWNAMIRRCRYPSMDRYARYGGRGIVVCAKWSDSFEAFLADVGRAPSPSHQLDRIDNDGNYEPGNVRWATRSEQIRNSTKARKITHNGKTLTLGEWSERTGIKRQALQMRLDHYGWPVARALETEVRHRIG